MKTKPTNPVASSSLIKIPKTRCSNLVRFLSGLLLVATGLSLTLRGAIIEISIPEQSQCSYSRPSYDNVWRVASPPYPLNVTSGIGIIINPTFLSYWEPADAALHQNDGAQPSPLYAEAYVPASNSVTVTYRFDRPQIVKGLEVIQHVNGVTRVEGFLGSSSGSVASLGSVFGPAGDVTDAFVVPEDGVSQIFDFGNTNISGTVFQFIVRKTCCSLAFAIHRAYPLDAAGRRIDADIPMEGPPIITRQPASAEVLSGSTLYLSVHPIGGLPFSYQWQHNSLPLMDGSRISGATSSRLQISAVTAEDAGTYTVVVTNNFGSTNSLPAVITILFKPPEITTQPTDQSVVSGFPVSLSVTATGSLPMTYQWRRNELALSDGGNIAGAQTSSLIINAVGIDDVGVYSVVVANAFGTVTSPPVALDVVIAAPRITGQPRSVAVAIGATASLEVQATGSRPLSFQWQRDGVNMVDGPRVSGSQASKLQIASLCLSDLGSYSVIVSNGRGWVRSAPTELSTWSAFLSVTVEASQIVVTWNDAGKGMTLQRTDSLSNPKWEDVAESEKTNAMRFPMTNAAAFFRLAIGSPSNRLIWIPPGSFIMGSPPDEVDRWDWEGPQTAVTISRGYWLGKYEVTQGEYVGVMGSNPSDFSTNNGYADGLTRPVEQVTWDDATAYCAALTARERLAGRIGTNSVYRLPTEARTPDIG